MQFFVPGKPLSLKRHRFSKGHCYNPSAKDQRAWSIRANSFRPPKLLDGPLEVSLEFIMPRPKFHSNLETLPEFHVQKPDIDNLAKFVLDCLNKTFYDDDSQVVILLCRKVYGSETGTRVSLKTVVTTLAT